MKSLVNRLLNASVATKLIVFSATLLLTVIAIESLVVVSMQKRTAVHEALLFADGIEKVALSGLTTMMITGQMQNRELLLGQINESGIVRDLRIIRGNKVNSVFGEGRQSEKVQYPFEESVLESGTAYVNEEPGDTLRIVKPIRAQANYLGKNCLGCHQAQPNEILGAITMQISLSEVAQQSRQFSFQILGAGLVVIVILISGLLLLTRLIITHPLDRLLELFRRLQQKDYTEKVVPRHQDEVGRLNEGVATFLHYTVELLTKLGKISQRLSVLAEKTRETSENFLQMSERQSTVIEEISASVSELKDSLHTEKEELTQFFELVAKTSQYATECNDTYRSVSAADREFREIAEHNARDFKRAYKILLDSLSAAEKHFGKALLHGETDKEEAIGLHRLIVGLNGVRTILKQALLSQLKATEIFLGAHTRIDALKDTIAASEAEMGRLKKLQEGLLEESSAQTEASSEISKTINMLSADAAITAAAAGDLAQMAHEASRLALLLKDLLHEFKLPA